MTQPMWLGIAILMVMPIVMVVLSLLLPHSANRWANIVVAVFFFLFNAVGIPTYPSAYDKFLLFRKHDIQHIDCLARMEVGINEVRLSAR